MFCGVLNMRFFGKAVCMAAIAAVIVCGGCSLKTDKETAITAKDAAKKDSQSSSAEDEKTHKQTSSPEESEDVQEGQAEKQTEREDSSQAETERDVSEEMTAQAAVMSGYYGFERSGFNMVYSNEKLEECFDKLQTICNNANFNLGFSYKNVNTGAMVEYNAYNRFLTCSTVKAPYVKYILSQGINLDEVVVRDDAWKDDDATVASSPYGMKFTVRQLIEYTLLESDNTAYYLLVRRYGVEGFNNYVYSLGANYSITNSWIFTYCTAHDMLSCYEDIYNFSLESKYGELLVNFLENADLNIQIGAALGDKYDVAQKYGSEFSEITFNDCAIVYADSPFILCIFTNQYPETEESCQVFKDLALVFDEINSLIAE